MAIRRLSTTSISNTGGKSSKLWDQTTILGTYECIASVTVDSGNQNGITFSNIPQTYTHLELRYVSRAPSTDSTNAVFVNRFLFNGLSTNIYDYQVMKGIGNGTTAASGEINKTNGPIIGLQSGGGTGSGYFGCGVVEILDYTSTTKNKVTRSITGCEVSGTLSEVAVYGGHFRSTNAITQIDILGDGSGYGRYSHFALYGIKA